MNRREWLTAFFLAMGGLGTGVWARLLNADLPPNGSSIHRQPLSALQLGHLQHFRNLAALPDGEWRHMGALVPGQETLDSYRYQLAFMAYALGLTAYHYLPAAPRILQPAFDCLIQKMLRREVWDYWKETSRSGPMVDPGLTTLRDGWVDPVAKENIMYSGHLLAMVGMYRMLFGDDKYDAEGSLTFRYDPIFYGLGSETFSYDHSRLNDVIYKQFSEHDWLGVPCEPNLVFVVCNQHPIFGFRFYDAVHGTNRAEEVIAAFDDAWKTVGGYVDDGSNISTMFMERQRQLIQQPMPLAAWTLTALNAWKPEFVRGLYLRLSDLWLQPRSEGRMSVRATNEILARASGQQTPAVPSMWRNPDFGYVAMWLSELGDEQSLESLLTHADQYMRPSWENGGLFYPRNDQSYDAAGELTFMDPLTGNALLGLSRLNPMDGIRQMFQNPWKPTDLQDVQIVGLSGADLLLATYIEGRNAIEFRLGGGDQQQHGAELLVAGLDRGRGWELKSGNDVVVSSSMHSDSTELDGAESRTKILLTSVHTDLLVLEWN